MTAAKPTSKSAAATSGQAERQDTGAAPSQRIDKWLWYVRAVKSRTLAAGLVTTGKVRVNKIKITKASTLIAAGDVIMITAKADIRLLKVLAPGSRRGPAAEARSLYEDLTPAAHKPPPPPTGTAAEQQLAERAVQAMPRRDAGAGRPTKRERRAIDRLRDDQHEGE